MSRRCLPSFRAKLQLILKSGASQLCPVIEAYARKRRECTSRWDLHYRQHHDTFNFTAIMAPMAVDQESNSLKPGDNTNGLSTDNKRKALEEPDDVSSSSKRIKSSHTASPNPEKRPLNVVPFPERVSGLWEPVW